MAEISSAEAKLANDSVMFGISMRPTLQKSSYSALASLFSKSRDQLCINRFETSIGDSLSSREYPMAHPFSLSSTRALMISTLLSRIVGEIAILVATATGCASISGAVAHTT